MVTPLIKFEYGDLQSNMIGQIYLNYSLYFPHYNSIIDVRRPLFYFVFGIVTQCM